MKNYHLSKISIFTFIFLVFSHHFANSQVKIGENPSIIHNSAILDLESTNKGLLLPRMTTGQRDAIQSPSEGLTIFNTTLHQYQFFNGTNWVASVPFSGATANVNLGNNSLTANSIIATNLTVNQDFTFNGIDIGRGGGNLNTNLALGENALISNNSGTYNFALGNDALYSNTNGGFNTALGNQSLGSNTSGHQNTGIGYYALGSNNSGSDNIGIGVSALQFNSSGSSNIAIGLQSMIANSEGNFNLGIGGSALLLTQGNRNIGLGDSSGYNLTTGNNNIAIGSKAIFPNETDSYQLVIGNEIYGKNVDNPTAGQNVQISIGTSSPMGTNMLTVAGTISANGTTLSSDRRFKKDIQAINLGLKEVLQLKPSSYYWNTKNERMSNADPTKLQYGFIAQELEAVIPAVVSGDGSEKDYKSVNYEALIPVLTKAIQELEEMLKNSNKKIEVLEKEIAILKNSK